MAKFFEKFLLRWHEGTVEEIEQLAKQYDALLPGHNLILKKRSMKKMLKIKASILKKLSMKI